MENADSCILIYLVAFENRFFFKRPEGLHEKRRDAVENHEIAQALEGRSLFSPDGFLHFFLSQGRLRLASNLGELKWESGQNTLLVLPSRVCMYFSRSYIFH